jgi:TonB family protein
MKENIRLILFFSGAVLLASPSTLLADNIQRQCKHAAQLLFQGDLRGAQGELDAILQKKPDTENAKVLLGVTLTKLGEQSEQRGDRARALAQLREALRLDPSEAYWHSAIAELLHAQGDADDAAKECLQAAQLSADDSGLAGGCGFGANREIWKDASYPEFRARTSAPENEVAPPTPTHHTNPSYTGKARRAHFQGVLVMWVVVGVQGDIEQAAVEKPLGLGLDQNALRAVRTWKFTPATRNSEPIPARVEVEVSFRLF